MSGVKHTETVQRALYKDKAHRLRERFKDIFTVGCEGC